jgi:hypothetical protein
MATRREFLMQTAAASIAAMSFRTVHASNAGSSTSMTSASGREAVVQTVLGPIDTSKLGFTLTHEHVIPGPTKIFDSRAISVSDAVDKLREARDAGVNTVVDLSPGEDGRDVRFVEEVSRKSGMHIVVCTGQRLFPPALRDRTTEALTELFIKEIDLGIDDTGIRAGVIKAASESAGVRVFEERVLRAAARASNATGVPIEHTPIRASVAASSRSKSSKLRARVPPEYRSVTATTPMIWITSSVSPGVATRSAWTMHSGA